MDDLNSLKDYPLNNKQRLSQEQDEMRLRGLRILARMIVRAHLDSLEGTPVEPGGEGVNGSGVPHRGDPPRQEGEHVG